MEKPAAEERILDAAWNIFIQKGKAAARMQEIADAAGINKAMLHYYFRSKDRLFEVVFFRALEDLLSSAAVVLGSPMPLAPKIESVVSMYIDSILERPALPLFVISEIQANPGLLSHEAFEKEEIQQEISLFGDQLRMAAEKGDIRRVEPEHLLMDLLGMIMLPFTAKSLFLGLMDWSDEEFVVEMNSRKKSIPAMLMASLRVPNPV
ncbi:TetR/AcrR family transcriptional regulator [Pontibacter sp. G13]|uniref:TetR/AcrR family transcriptional regulator n=1 Tax=Pontibacter sp. G13 TaxID=3074898 RepID=UPI00288B7AC4|nr:TetR/AcrR family transcriptional regulator [Pontibacter sp. G13]WNJ21357.1 TetR/AcrR family transcriptional regulator [Pontibacter sp. G13]